MTAGDVLRPVDEADRRDGRQLGRRHGGGNRSISDPGQSGAQMRAKRHGSWFGSVILTTVLIAGSGCGQGSQSGENAFLDGFSSVDLVSGNRSMKPDGQKDAAISLRVAAGGTITTLTVHNVDGQVSTWDTTPGSAAWALGVADKDKPEVLLNRSDGSVAIKVDQPKDLVLYFADNGAIRDGKTRFAVTVAYADGTTKEVSVAKR